MRSTAAIPAAAEELRRWLLDRGADNDSVRVKQVEIQRDEDFEGAAILRFDVTLEDPAGDAWPVEDTLTFHDRVNQKAQELELPLPWHVSIVAEHDEPVEYE